ncbi:DMT family transporter [Pontivivens insulae]|uniref:EamA domain-containing protein n=1 Tax=Pontivivens insulae TaxID=1639689 RepID=A0A2R8AAP8_9RHOB|nr:DMT family transporter [Pontivivens insulae]RED13038.1 threonine/homoserine efflux transporter RhtA [Pontivivens insulae]SPF29130.1 hypothetical protein POI8812_01436 [Pontivivens insulae]
MDQAEQTPPDWLAIGAVGALVVTWGSAFALTDVALTGFGPLAVVSARAGLAAFVLCLAALLTEQGLPRTVEHWVWCGVIGITSLALPFTLLTWAQLTVDSTLAAILISGGPLFVLIFARLILGTPLTLRRVLGFVVGLAGLVVLIGPGALSGLGGDVLAQLACLGTAACYAFSSVLVKRMPPVAPIPATAASQLTAALIILPFGGTAFATEFAVGPALLALVVLGCIQTGAAQLLRFWTVRRAGPVFMASVSYLIPVWAGFVGVAFLGETITPSLVIGFALIISGLLVARPGR